MKHIMIFILVGWITGSCAEAGTAKSTPSVPPGPNNPLSPVDMDTLEDNRRTGPGFHTHIKNPDWHVRLRAAEAIGRIGSPDLAPLLIDLLQDREAAVRDGAVFASGLLGGGSPQTLRQSLIDLLQRETRPEGIGALLGALSNTGSADLCSTFIKFAENPESSIRSAALKALGVLGIGEVDVPRAHIKRIAKYLSDPNDSVRLMAAFALYRIPPKTQTDKEVLTGLLKAANHDPALEVRAYALRAFARRGAVTEKLLQEALKSNDNAISATGISIIDFAPESKRCPLVTAAIKPIATRLEKDPSLLQTAFIHTVRSALERGVGCPRAKLQKPLSAIAKAAKSDPTQSAGSARVLCQTHQLAGSDDVILTSCDPTRPHVGKRMLIERLGRGDKTNRVNLSILKGLTEDSDPRVATSAIGVLAAMGGPPASQMVINTLTHRNPLGVAAALDGIAQNPENFKKFDGDILQHIDAVIERFVPFNHVYGPLISALGAIKSLSLGEAEPLLLKLAADRRPAIRQGVLDAYRALSPMTPPAGLPKLRPPNPITKEQMKTWRELSAIAHVSTTRGLFSFTLLSSRAPGTVGRFMELAQTGYYNDTEIHRVVPNFVVQAGDPTGTGLGDPGYAIRCEINSIPYEKGTVGMALSGKDTGGSQFFVTLSRQPHLDGNYTVFGKIIEGMNVVNLIEEGDQILGISIEK